MLATGNNKSATKILLANSREILTYRHIVIKLFIKITEFFLYKLELPIGTN